MKTLLHATLILFNVSMPIFYGHAGAVTFDSPTDLATQFTVNGSEGNFSHVPTGGITGGALDVVTPFTSDTVVYNSPFANGAGSALSTSLFWRYDASIQNTLTVRYGLTLGFAQALSFPNDPFQEQWGLDVGMYFYSGGNNPRLTLRFFSGNTGISQGNYATLTSGNWYQTVFTYENAGGPFSAVNLSSHTFDFGPSGTGSPAEVTELGDTMTFANPGIAGTSQLFAGFRSQREGGVDLIDNFDAAVVVPEPCSGVLLSFASLMLIGRRFRKAQGRTT